MLNQRERLRRWRRRADNPEVANTRRLLTLLRSEGSTGSPTPDIVQLGASESLFVGPTDADRRTLPELIEAGLGPGHSVATFCGGGYHAGLFDGVVRQLGARTARPVLLIVLTARLGYAPWSRHPLYSYYRAQRWLRAARPGRPPWSVRAALPLPSQAEMDAFDAVPYASVAGCRSVGEYRRSLRDPARHGLSRDEAIAQLYAYHHGATDAIEPWWLDGVQRFGATARELGFPVVTYQSPIPIQRGVELWGDRLADINARALASIDTAFRAGYGPAPMVQTGLSLGSETFIDLDDATEHVNDRGRVAIADVIVPELARTLAAAAR